MSNIALSKKSNLLDVLRAKTSSIMQGKEANKFIADIVSLLNTNSTLKTCDEMSLFSSCVQAKTLNLSLNPNLGQAYIVPFKDKATFQVGYRGYIQLAIRSGVYKRLNVLELKKGELISYNPLSEVAEVQMIEDYEVREGLETVAYFAMFEYLNGFVKSLLWSKDKMQKHAEKYSTAYKGDLKRGTKYSFWSSQFDDMAKKTMLRQLISKWGIMSEELQNAYISDMGAIDVDGTVEYVDNQTRVSNNFDEIDFTSPSVDERPKYIFCPNREEDEEQKVDAAFCEKCLSADGCPSYEDFKQGVK